MSGTYPKEVVCKQCAQMRPVKIWKGNSDTGKVSCYIDCPRCGPRTQEYAADSMRGK